MINSDIKNHFPRYARPSVLYHATSQGIEEAIEPCEQWTCTRKERGAFVFATETRQAAYAYCLKTDGFMATHNANGPGQPPEYFNLVRSREAFYRQNPQGYIHCLAPEDFEPVVAKDGSYTGEWIARKAVPVAAEHTIHVKGIEETMQQGIQFLFADRELTESEIALLDSKLTIPVIAHLIKTGAITWENERQGINPSAALVRELSPTPAQLLARFPA